MPSLPSRAIVRLLLRNLLAHAVSGIESPLDPAAEGRCVLAREMDAALGLNDCLAPLAHLAGPEHAEGSMGVVVIDPAVDDDFLDLIADLRKGRPRHERPISRTLFGRETGQRAIDEFT